MTTAHGQRSRTCGGVPFLLKMPTTMREGTSMVGKNGIWQPTTAGGEMQAMGAALMVAATDDVGLRRLWQGKRLRNHSRKVITALIPSDRNPRVLL
ncbi:hypothetical protein BHE74_00026395 [Ensete ventricosum]|nr:hypothetical protein BHE74_00026395 [Ensete ventricosum]